MVCAQKAKLWLWKQGEMLELEDQSRSAVPATASFSESLLTSVKPAAQYLKNFRCFSMGCRNVIAFKNKISLSGCTQHSSEVQIMKYWDWNVRIILLFTIQTEGSATFRLPFPLIGDRKQNLFVLFWLNKWKSLHWEYFHNIGLKFG